MVEPVAGSYQPSKQPEEPRDRPSPSLYTYVQSAGQRMAQVSHRAKGALYTATAAVASYTAATCTSIFQSASLNIALMSATPQAQKHIATVRQQVADYLGELRASKGLFTPNSVTVQTLTAQYVSEKNLKVLSEETLPTSGALRTWVSHRIANEIRARWSVKDAPLAAWQMENRAFNTIQAFQSADPNRSLGTGICYHSALRIHVLRQKYPHASDQELRQLIIEDVKSSEPHVEQEVTEKGRYFSRRDRFFHAHYEVEYALARGSPDDVSRLALRYYGVQQLNIPIGSNLSSATHADYMVTRIEDAIADNIFAPTNHSFLLAFGSHAIELDINHESGTYALWEPNGGRYSFPDYETFRDQLVSYITDRGQDHFEAILSYFPLITKE